MGQRGDSRAVTPKMLASVKGGHKRISWDLAEEENGPSIGSTPELQLIKILQFVQIPLFMTLELNTFTGFLKYVHF